MGIHIGHLIKTEFDRQGRRAMWLASELNCNRANVYNIFQRDNIDIAMLVKISKVLEHNFFQDIANLIDNYKCLKTIYNMSKNQIHNVQKDDTAS